jgi:hypothetical protein
MRTKPETIPPGEFDDLPGRMNPDDAMAHIASEEEVARLVNKNRDITLNEEEELDIFSDEDPWGDEDDVDDEDSDEEELDEEEESDLT